MPAAADLDRTLREAGAQFIEAHDRAEQAIKRAVDAGMSLEAIEQVSGLSAQTVAAFARAGTPSE